MSELFTDNAGLGRFELKVDERLAFARYRREPGRLVVLYVEAEPALRGTGAAGRLMGRIAELARREGRDVIPACRYAAAWLKHARLDPV